MDGSAFDIDLTLRLGLPCPYKQIQDGQEESTRAQETLSFRTSQHSNSKPYAPGFFCMKKPNLTACEETDSKKPTTSSNSSSSDFTRSCSRCGKTKTPLWRKGPNGPQSLCNACGLHHARVLKKVAKEQQVIAHY